MFDLLENQLKSIIEDEDNFITNASNFSALVFNSLPDLNWVGFYLMSKDYLLLSTFQGKVACIKIPIGKGVCGTAVQSKETIVVNNVHLFPGHIACDETSNSEIVIPIIINNVVFGVLDIDSVIFNRFTDEDKYGLEKLLKILIDNSNMNKIYKYYND